ncbi:RidA family protein (plasmid) [Paraburkholderia graminis]|uniref:RidA family protein n=1 Tax=Paraburkholderia graminis TaxID=60548 RepID=UPI000DEF00B3|nr:RidA family protein [Paraburkholderia graminis]AXF12700.1 RidA family protein [Paraburkholderia graminis]
MRTVIDTGLAPLNQPFSWMVKTPGLFFTAHGPVTADGKIADADIEAQAKLTFDNLRLAVEAAGRTMDDVAQVLIYMIDASHMPIIDAVYRTYFAMPYPNRSSVVVAGFVHPAMKIEIVAYVNAQ